MAERTNWQQAHEEGGYLYTTGKGRQLGTGATNQGRANHPIGVGGKW